MPAFRKKLVYVYDALCPWCYAFTPVVKALYESYQDRLDHEVISGGMVRADQVRIVGGEEEAARLRESYRSIEEHTGARFGDAFYAKVAKEMRRLDSEPPAIALAAFRRMQSGISQLNFAHAIITGIFWEGGDPNDEQFYLQIAERLNLNPEAFLAELRKQESKDQALYDFALARQLGADAFPRLYLQTAEDYLHLISRGYSEFDHVRKIIDSIGT